MILLIIYIYKKTIEINCLVTELIFLKKYTKILDFITDVCNKNKKETNVYYNKDNISQAAQDFFKRQNYKNK